MDARAGKNEPPITHIVYIGEATDNNSFLELTAQYPQSKREPGTLYIIRYKSRQGGTPCVAELSIQWPAALLSFNWIPVPDQAYGSVCNLWKLPVGQKFSITGPKVSHANVAECVEIINEFKTEMQKAQEELQRFIQNFLRDEQGQDNRKLEKKITAFFSADMLASVKKLRSVLFHGQVQRGKPELFNFDQANFYDIKVFAELVKTLERLEGFSYTKMTPQEAANNPIIKDIATTAHVLHQRLQLRADKKEGGLIIARLLWRILNAIAFALAGFKSGATLGAMVGGGVASVPSAMIGGCIGLLVGGGLGLFVGDKWKLPNRMSKRYAENDYSTAINDSVKRRGGVPALEGRLSR